MYIFPLTEEFSGDLKQYSGPPLISGQNEKPDDVSWRPPSPIALTNVKVPYQGGKDKKLLKS